MGSTRTANLPRVTAVEALNAILNEFNIKHDGDALKAGTDLVLRGGDFADALIAHEDARAGASILYTFDRRFAKRNDPAVCRVELLEA